MSVANFAQNFVYVGIRLAGSGEIRCRILPVPRKLCVPKSAQVPGWTCQAGGDGVRGLVGLRESTWRAFLSLRDPDAWTAEGPPALRESRRKECTLLAMVSRHFR